MAIFLTEQSRVIVQGITGSEGRRHGARMLAAGTNVVGGTNPRKAGQAIELIRHPGVRADHPQSGRPELPGDRVLLNSATVFDGSQALPTGYLLSMFSHGEASFCLSPSAIFSLSLSIDRTFTSIS